MAQKSIITSSWRKQKLYNSSSESAIVRSDFIAGIINTSPKVAGNVVILDNGVKFRKATALTKFTSSVQVGAPQVYVGKRTDALRKGQTGYVYESAGGCFGDNILRQSTCAAMVDGFSVTSAISGPFTPTLLRNQAVTNALLSLADQKAGYGEDLATLGQTIRMLAHPAQGLYKFLCAATAERKFWLKYRRETARSLGRLNLVDAAAKRYLEYVYGVRPLMQDIYGMLELAKEYGINPLLLHGRGTARQQYGLPGFTYPDISNKSKTTFTGGSEDVRVNCSLWAKLDPNWSGARALNQCGMLNPASLAWELVSLSFVIDWFVPIGPVLSALTAPAGLSFVDGTTSVRTKAHASLETWGYGLDDQPYDWSTTSKASATWTYDGYDRNTLTGFPLPGFWINTDPLGFGRNSDRPLKALALAITNLKAFR